MIEYQQPQGRYHGGFSLLEMLISLAMIALILSTINFNLRWNVSSAVRVADNANARQAFTYLCSQLVSETSEVNRTIQRIAQNKALQVNYVGPIDSCNTARGSSAVDTLKRNIVKNVPGLKGKGLRIYYTRDAGGQYQIVKVAVFSNNPEKAAGSEAAQATGSYPLGA